MFAQANYNQLSSNANMKAQLDPWNKFVGSFASEAGSFLGGGAVESVASKL
jgi:hypothetical protein